MVVGAEVLNTGADFLEQHFNRGVEIARRFATNRRIELK
jgi:hypothetical protein